MKSLNEIREILNKHKNNLKEKYGVIEIGIFGSYVRNEQKKTSDIDILVKFEKPLGLEFVITPLALKQKPRLWESVKEDLIYV